MIYWVWSVIHFGISTSTNVVVIPLLSKVIEFSLYQISKATPSTRLVQMILRIVLSLFCQCFKKIYDVCCFDTAKLRPQRFNPLVCIRWAVYIRSLTALFIIMISPEIALHSCYYNIFSATITWHCSWNNSQVWNIIQIQICNDVWIIIWLNNF